MFPMMVRLPWNQVEAAAMCGCRRRVYSIRDNRKDAMHLPPALRWWGDIAGALGEAAASQYFKVPFVPHIDVFKTADVIGYEVRATSYPNGRLIVRKDDIKYPLLLSIADPLTPNVVHLIGTAQLDFAKQERFRGDDCWWVPQDDLTTLPTAGVLE